MDEMEASRHAQTQVYIFCNLCPLICLSEEAIVEHIAKVHKNKEPMLVQQLSCPACHNTFLKRESLESHLRFDHSVTQKTDLDSIVKNICKSEIFVSFDALQQVREQWSLNGRNDAKSMLISRNQSLEDAKIILTDYNESLPIFQIDSKNEHEDIPLVIIPHNTDTKSDFRKPILSAEGRTLITEEDEIGFPVCGDSVSPKESKCPPSLTADQKAVVTGGRFVDIQDKHRCPKCAVKLANIEKMTYHLSCHVNTIFACPECQIEFADWRILAGHLWRSHHVDMELFACDKCEYRTVSRSKLINIHQPIHGTARNFPCNVCGRTFKNVKQMRNHRSLTHATATTENGDVVVKSQERACAQCPKSFTDSRRLRMHIDAVHKKLKPFLCSVCGYKGATRAALKTHVRQHTGEKPCKCDKCDFATTDHNSLRRHKLRHSDNRPYKCSHCSYSCIQSNTYKVHLKTKHPGLEKDLIFACDFCTFRSVNKNVYTSHLRTVHGE